MELIVYKFNGEKTDRKVVLNDSIFNIEPNDHSIYLDVKQYLANQRQGTHSSKERSAVSGSTRKLKRQKGTGGARIGDVNSPLLRGGGRVFGPHPRDYHFKLNKKVKRLARMSALTYKAKESQIVVVEDFTFEAPKTKFYREMLSKFESTDLRSLMVLKATDMNVVLAARNLKKSQVLTADSLNTYEILNAKKIFLLESSIKEIENMFA